MSWICAWSDWRSGAAKHHVADHEPDQPEIGGRRPRTCQAADGARGEMMDRFAATLRCSLQHQHRSSDGRWPAPAGTCSNPDEVVGRRAPGSSGPPSMHSHRCTSSAFRRSRRPRSSNAPSISCAVAHTRSPATPASSRSSSRLRPSGHAPLRGQAWASPSIRAQGRASIWASIPMGAPSPKSGDTYRCRPLGRRAADQQMRFAAPDFMGHRDPKRISSRPSTPVPSPTRPWCNGAAIARRFAVTSIKRNGQASRRRGETAHSGGTKFGGTLRREHKTGDRGRYRGCAADRARYPTIFDHGYAARIPCVRAKPRSLRCSACLY